MLSETIPAPGRTQQGIWAGFVNLIDRLAFAVLILLALTFAFEAPLGGKLGGEADITTVKILQVLVIGLWIVARRLNRRWPHTPRRLIMPVCLWLAVLLLSTLLAPDSLSHTIRFLSRIVQGLLLAWIAYDLVNTPGRWRLVACTLVIAGVIVALLGLAEAVGIPVVLDFLRLFRESQTRVGDVVRVSSSLEYATIAAMVLEMLIPLTVAWIVTTSRHWLKILLFMALIVDVVAMVLTLTRSALAGVVVAFIVIGVVSLLRHRRDSVIAAVGTIGLVVVSVILLLVANPIVGLRLLSESETGWYQVRYVAPPQVTAHPDELVSIPVQLTNMGLHTWQAQASTPFRLGFTLTNVSDSAAKGLDGPRTDLPTDVPPGQTVMVNAQIPAPQSPGEYLIRWDMVEETVLWFSWRGSVPGSTRLIVAGDPILNMQRPNLSVANHSSAAPPVERPALWAAALRIFRAKPLFGAGPDNFRWIYGRYLTLDHWDTNIHANSIYFEWLADTGLFGLLAFLWLNWRLVRTAWQGLNRQTDPNLWIWQLALIASLIAWFVHGFLDNFYEFAGTYVLFWLMVGLAINVCIYHPQPTDESTR